MPLDFIWTPNIYTKTTITFPLIWLITKEATSKNKDKWESPDDDRLKQNTGRRERVGKITERKKTTGEMDQYTDGDKREEGEEDERF